MSSPSANAGWWAAAALLALTLLASCSGSTVSYPATAQTATLASVEAAHICTVSAHTFRTEQAITDDLVAKLKAQGFDYPTWKAWHDSLVKSGPRAAQLAAATKAVDCPTR